TDGPSDLIQEPEIQCPFPSAFMCNTGPPSSLICSPSPACRPVPHSPHNAAQGEERGKESHKLQSNTPMDSLLVSGGIVEPLKQTEFVCQQRFPEEPRGKEHRGPPALHLYHSHPHSPFSK
ncbi:hypothetical protein KUCAC02_010319, partial [Chaenocephalus aceratus]